MFLSKRDKQDEVKLHKHISLLNNDGNKVSVLKGEKIKEQAQSTLR